MSAGVSSSRPPSSVTVTAATPSTTLRVYGRVQPAVRRGARVKMLQSERDGQLGQQLCEEQRALPGPSGWRTSSAGDIFQSDQQRQLSTGTGPPVSPDL